MGLQVCALQLNPSVSPRLWQQCACQLLHHYFTVLPKLVPHMSARHGHTIPLLT